MEVWPENWRSFDLFAQMQTQWMTGMGGGTGLRYEALYPLLDRKAEDREDWDSLFEDVRIMESQALRTMAVAREKGEAAARRK